MNAKEHSFVNISCLVKGRPPPSIRIINATDPEQFLNQSQTTGDMSIEEQSWEVNLIIKQVPCEASGLYICEANNSLGKDSQNRTLLVYCKYYQ